MQSLYNIDVQAFDLQLMAAAVGLPSLDLYLLSQLFLLVFCRWLVSILAKLYLSMDMYMSYYHPSIKLNYIQGY